MNTDERSEMYRQFLLDEGYKPEVDSDGDVRFKKEGGQYFISVDKSDEQYFTVIFPSFWQIRSEEERRVVLIACDQANALSKVAKVFTVSDNVWAACELFVVPPEGFKPIFERAMSALQNGVRNFGDYMQKESGRKEEASIALGADVENDSANAGKKARTTEEVSNAPSQKP